MGRPRDRSSGMGLLPRMEARPWADGKTVTYRYKPVGAKPINLGTDKQAALRKVLDLNQQTDHYGTLLWVWEKFQESARWKKYAADTQKDYQEAWKQIGKVFAHMPSGSITAPMLARYTHVERAEAPKRANTELALLSRLFGYGITLGVCTMNPTIGVERHQLEARTIAPDPELLQRFLSWLDEQTPQRQIIGMAAEYASLAGNRKVEFLRLEWSSVDLQKREVSLVRAKQRGKKRGNVVEVISMSDRLYALFLRLRAIREARPGRSHWVFQTRDGNGYTAKGFATLWHRSIGQAIQDGVIAAEDRFTFHDLRAYYATQHKAQRKKLPDLHANPDTTARVYDRSKRVSRSALD